MTTQTIQFESVSLSEIGSGTITAFLFSGATLSATLSSIAENSTLKGRYTGTVADVAAGDYRLVVKFDGYTVSEPDETVTLLLAVGTYVSKRLAVLDSATQTQLDNIENTAAQRAFGIVERPPSDTGVITFVWPALGATITGTVSLNNASYIPVIGAFEFLRTDGGKYFYTLAYNTADRPVSAGSARYALTDGTYTRYLVLRVVESGDTGETTALAVLCFDWEAVTGEVPSRSVLNALRHIRNKWALDGNTKTVYAEDDTTPAYTTSVTADGAGNIIADTPD